MKLYTVRHEEAGEVLCIAARSMDHAAQVFITFMMVRTGSAPGKFDVDRGAPPDYAGNLFVANVANGNVAGVIVRERNGSMLFDPHNGE